MYIVNYEISFFCFEYRVSHKEWDYKDDLKLLKYEDFKIKLSLLPEIISFNGLFIDLTKNKHECKKTDNIHQGCNVRKVNCSFVYSAYILKPVFSGRNS